MLHLKHFKLTRRKVKRTFQICEHLGISHLTEKKVKIDNNKLTTIQEHSIYYHFRHDHESSSFRKLARNKWSCRETCDFFVM